MVPRHQMLIKRSGLAGLVKGAEMPPKQLMTKPLQEIKQMLQAKRMTFKPV